MSSCFPTPRRASRRVALVALLALSPAPLAGVPGSALAAEQAAEQAPASAKPAREKAAPAKATARPKAADRDTARRLVMEGDAFYERREFARALERYSLAYAAMRVPTVGIEVIKAQTALGKLVEAQAIAQEVASAPKKRGEPAVFEEARQRAAQSNLRLTGMIPSLWLEVSPAGVVFEVEIDGVTPATSPPYQLNPGPHTVRVLANGYQTRQLDITLREAERLNRRADLIAEKGTPAAATVSTAASVSTAAATTSGATTPSATAPSSPTANEPSGADESADLPAPSVAATPAVAASAAPAERAAMEPGETVARQGSSTRMLGWMGLAVAGAAAGVGTYAGIRAFSSKPDCPNDTCTPSQQDDIDSSTRMGTIANVSVGVAVVTGALGIWALASSGDDDSKESASLRNLPVTVGLGKLNEIRISGRF